MSYELRKLRKQNQRIFKKIENLEFAIQSLVNSNISREIADWVDNSTKQLNSNSLDLYNFSYSSQHGEDGIIFKILKSLGINSGVSYEIGAGDNGGNTGILALNHNFQCNFIETDINACTKLRERFLSNNVRVINEHVTVENINDLVIEKPTVLSIDIDSYDYWILAELNKWPDVLIAEYNSTFGTRDLVVSKEYDFDSKKYSKSLHIYGASLKAITRLANSKGYELIYCEPSGTNAYFLSDSYAGYFQALDSLHGYRSSNRSRLFQHRKLSVETAILAGDLIEFPQD